MPGTSAAAFDAIIGIVGLQVGYFAGMVGRSLASSLSRRDGDAVVERQIVAGTVVAMAGDAPAPDLVGPQAPVARSGLDDRLKDLFRQAPGFMVVFRGPEHIVESTNDAYRDLVGARSIVGRPIP